MSAHAVDLYLYVCARSEWKLEDASVDLGVRVSDVALARDELLARRLLTPLHEGESVLAATAPDVALAELVDDDERRIHELRAAVARQRSELMALLPAYREARDAVASVSQVEVVEDPATVMRLLIDLGRRVCREALIMQPGSGASVERHEESDQKDRELLAQGVARRTMYHDRRRDHVPTQRTVAELEPLGAQFRTLPLVPFRLLIFDRTLALVSRQRDDDDRAALVIRSPDVVSAFVRAFDAAWEFASPFRAAETETVERTGLSAIQSAILSGLASGLTDEVIASRLDISVRTCRRHIAGLFDLLGAESRFQAGVLATQQGLLPTTAVPNVRGGAIRVP
ncbi:helix-turn-helix transcriptional regulator [Rathayibacter toxicus]|uniref:helix-turn-helix transcriptional regulator n=1 Tax=Rathayibacter toxicus TaxID=145458 RepID=UPI000401803A|nr:helix-turn-helix transcriptional regulator [Rathayibacter toxicus]QOD08097.1 helix-turn-helix transcriptional regulator [Rathayibacter toxicus]QOD10194.1 helix-turn-helix transcriptional regulator [Rathayibacter toxicus]QWL26760.1 LuxR family transcriptional regulator [Rathayibacter toxicus]QWL28870.1 LuxR family transcriptional regulator [Rathayibacter toxicus]QWL30974.1 LuxR family transcriptional regulator [Rathayibacter toxicus]